MAVRRWSGTNSEFIFFIAVTINREATWSRVPPSLAFWCRMYICNMAVTYIAVCTDWVVISIFCRCYPLKHCRPPRHALSPDYRNRISLMQFHSAIFSTLFEYSRCKSLHYLNTVALHLVLEPMQRSWWEYTPNLLIEHTNVQFLTFTQPWSPRIQSSLEAASHSLLDSYFF